MIMGAACAFVGAYLSDSVVVGAICGMMAGAAMAAIFAALTLGLAVNQVATGLALTILGTGLSGLIGADFVGQRITPAAHLDLPILTDLPLVGKILFGQDAFVYISIALVIAIWLFLYRTRTGLVLRAVGDNHTSAHALGYPVRKNSPVGSPVRRGVRRVSRCLSAARLYALFHSRHDSRQRLDCPGAGGVRILAAGTPGWRRLPVWCGDDPAVACSGSWTGHSIAVDVVASLSCHGDRSGLDFTYARQRRVCRTCFPWCGFRTRPMTAPSARDGRLQCGN